MATAATTARSSALEGFVDLDRYPLHELDSPAGRQLIEDCREQLGVDGCVVLKNFVPRTAIERLERETVRLSPKAHYNEGETNPYNSDADPELPPEHPKNRFDDRTNGFVAGDCIDNDTIIRRIHADGDFQRFIAAVVGMEEIHPYADPLADLVVNVLREGCQHPWHYDTNEFIVTMLTRKPNEGGRFEYVPGLRSPESENFEGVQRVLDGDRPDLKSLELELGDLQIFFGRYSLHRVTPVRGERERHSVIFAYAQEPGFIGRPERAQRIFGRMAPVHERMLAEGSERHDGLAD
ncbi:MAG: hypothetical protein U5K73_02420 [Halofilum sp. (in: g-proteobacteria)]|nr:hypothetical protein [Halofilum sp. (in: g-proteobacteria)]